MKPSIEKKLTTVQARYEALKTLLSDPGVTKDLNKYRELTKEYAQVEPTVLLFGKYQAAKGAHEEAEAMLADDDAEMRMLAEQEIEDSTRQMESIEEELLQILLPVDPNDESNIFLEIRAGTGGNEAAIFAGDLFRMYSRYAETKRYSIEILSQSDGEHGGYKEVIARVIGRGAYGRLKFESGAHRVQRVPETEAQGRIHTSACTVAILPEVAEIESIEINPADIRTDTFRASGAGGQHVQKTDSAIRITHIPTGTVVECQDERSQHKNRARAMSLLKAKILAAERDKQHQQQAETRRSLVGTGDRSERIRTYNFPQGRLTDHRINLTLYQLASVMEGELDQVIDPLAQEYNADLIATLGI